MKTLNVLFPDQQRLSLDSLADELGVTKSVLSRAAMQVGLDTISQLTSQSKEDGRRYTMVNEAFSKG
jgi:hypothetical protein